MTLALEKIRRFGIGKILAGVAIAAFMVMMLAKPSYYLDSARRGLSLYATSVLPSLFPFYFCSLLLTNIGAARAVSQVFKRPVKTLFNAPKESAYILILSMLSGYPVGASMTAELYAAGVIDHQDAKRIAAFASTSGPVFILGTVGSAIYGDISVGVIILIAHYIAAFLNGIIFRGRSNYRQKQEKKSSQNKLCAKRDMLNNKQRIVANSPDAAKKDCVSTQESAKFSTKNSGARFDVFDNSGAKINAYESASRGRVMLTGEQYDDLMAKTIASSTINMLYVGGYIVLCGMLVDTLPLLGADRLLAALPSGIADAFNAVFAGLIEMTRGCIAAADCTFRHISIALSAGIVSLGGLSVTLQNYTFLSKCGMSFFQVILRKLTQGALAFAAAFLLSFLII